MSRTYTLTDEPDGPGDYHVTSRIRRCNGCSACITTHPGSCSQEDTFSPEIPPILSSDVLVIDSGIDSDMIRMPMRKSVERLSNILLAWTDAGHNVPRDKSETPLRRIIVRCPGPGSEGFEHYMREMLLKGPIEKLAFEYYRYRRRMRGRSPS